MRNSRSERAGYLFILPWFLGLLLFTLGPMLFSFVLSFSKWDIITGIGSIEFVGLDNFKAIFHDELFYQSLKVTFIFALVSVPLYQIVSLLIALLLNMRTRGMKLFRLIYFMPSVIPAVAVSMMWIMIFNPEYGILNRALGWFGIQGPAWLQDPSYALGALIVMGIWGVGNTIIIYLSGLQGVPEELHEAAQLDGAGSIRRFFSVTMPMISPTIFFNLIMGIIGGFQYFTQAFVMTNGGPLNSTLFYNLYLYNKAFVNYEMGYASALSWILFAIILFFTLIVIRSSSMWVYYNGDDDRD
ncbi:carbohydrate ABC transporter permease [Paenibacillus cellulositrophicus]|uniref:ABC transporter permease n=1 Tax=Paenibacillus rhizosphaerae TaxID=297318 RepID=A0A1R1EU35_9BACL|nr:MULTISPECIES: sugar ABC transporter permease [Paenibacillus]MCM2999787.1 sugar ABC transporter permease [Paenibacillus cellulositrophicus]MEC0176098.1 sugar ABC transporter permease [Paenibacillus favisporus]OMF55305.1 ABC transporter permease [Paenibacillus rhizosphaerae]OXL85052.1 ABC transporter permease [Paenibacillus sp. SSG-1]RED39016.1 carbohydrate ABC transporter membrane protein 1 (CUT1 family) [Paenibacillus sp. VMFN-D1]